MVIFYACIKGYNYRRFLPHPAPHMSVMLTEKQQVILRYLQAYLTTHQQSPLIREIQSGCGIVSYKSTVDRLNALERKGWIERVTNKHRGIHLLRRLEDAPSLSAEDPQVA